METSQHLYPREGAEGEERFLYLGKSPHQQRSQLRQERSFGGSEKKTQQLVYSRWTVRPRLIPCHSLVCPSLRLPTTDVGRGPGLECHVWRAGPGTELQLARQRQLEGAGGQSTIAAKVPGVGPDSHRDGASLLDDVQGATTVAPLHMEAPAA